MKVQLSILLVITLTLSVSAQQQNNLQLLPRKFPSLRVGLVIPGSYAKPTDPDAQAFFQSRYSIPDGAPDSVWRDAVAQWEAESYDLSSGGDIPQQFRNLIPTTAYMYFQSLQKSSDDAGHGTVVLAEAIKRGLDYEDLFLHYKRDTYMEGKTIGPSKTNMNGVFSQVGQSTSFTGYVGYWDKNNENHLRILQYSNAGGGLWLAFREKFDEITFILSEGGDPGTSGQLIIEYPNAVTEDFKIAGWGQTTPYYDSTNGLRNSGTMRFIPPADWKWTRPTDTNLGSAAIARGMGVYVIRIRTPNYAVYPRFAPIWDHTTEQYFVRMRSCVTVETTDYRRGTVLRAGTNYVDVTYQYAQTSTDYYKDMTVTITSGTGAGQTRTIIASGGTTGGVRLTVSPDWEVIPDSTSQFKITGPTTRVRGWDPANDRNGDGYVDDNEFANLANPEATARLRHEGRVTHGVTGWSPYNAACRPNLWNPNYKQILLDYYIPLWQSTGIVGYYNDDLANGFKWPVLYGGEFWEVENGTSYDEQTHNAYLDLIVDVHQSFRSRGVVTGGNISSSNMITSSELRRFLGALDYFICEDSVINHWTLSAWLGVCRFWDHMIYIQHYGMKLLVMGQMTYMPRNILGNTQETWELMRMSQLAQYYLLNVPDKYIAQFWRGPKGSWSSFSYGSRNTNTDNFWKAGVPYNMAYTPHDVLKVDIGDPTNRIPGNYNPMPWIGPDRTGTTIIGYSNQSQITVPNVGTYNIYTPYTFFLWESPRRMWNDSVPVEAVVAREYTKGLVLYRAPVYLLSYLGMTDAQYISDQNAITVPLPGMYRRVNYDGTLGPPITQVTIRGFEGIILKKADETPPDVQITIQTDKSNPKPLDVVTVTITARNNGTGEARNVRIRHTVPMEATYELGSLRLNGQAQPDPVDRRNIDLTVASIPPGGQAVVQFRMVIR